jgi:hypothetical protein
MSMICRFLALALVAVSFAGTASAHTLDSGLPDARVQASGSLETDIGHTASSAPLAQAELHADHDCNGYGHPGNSCCPGIHGHCCASSPALLDRDAGLVLTPPARRAWASFDAALPSGQRIHPPHRPPRISA